MKQARLGTCRYLPCQGKRDAYCLGLPWVFLILLCWQLFSQSQVFAHDTKPSLKQSTIAPESVRVLIVSTRYAVLASEISARIKSITKDAGESFKYGQPLIIMDIDLYQARIKKIKAEHNAAEKSLAIYKKLTALGSVSELEMVGAQGRMEAARADLAIEQIQMNQGIIKAPFDGCVIKRMVNPHEYVTPGQPLIEIINKSLKLQLYLPSVWLQWLKPGINFKVAVDETGKTYPARIIQLAGRIDPVSQTIEVWADIIGKYPELLAGMSGVCQFADQDRLTP
jgi:RND family efflux transporter MFP subunit